MDGVARAYLRTVTMTDPLAETSETSFDAALAALATELGAAADARTAELDASRAKLAYQAHHDALIG